MIQKIYDVVVIGGGASGMMSALVASQNGAQVALIEKNKRLGEKLRITGGGRCNILNAEYDQRMLLSNFGQAEKFLYSSFAQFGVEETVSFFNNLGIQIKIEARKRAFPETERAEDVVYALIHALNKLKVDIFTSSPVTKINHSKKTIFSVACGNRTIKGRQYILATGGTSRPETGSTGDGFGWLRLLGHSVKNPSPSITPLAASEPWLKHVSGITAKQARITFFCDDTKAFKVEGDVLFTHFGISGPVILNNAHKVAELLEQGTVTAHIDLLPSIDQRALDEHIVSLLHQHGTKQLKNTVRFLVPEGLAPLIKSATESKVQFALKSAELPKQQRQLLVESIKKLALTITGLMGEDRAVVADGGIALTELNMRTFQSNHIDNLCVTGDLLDINRPSGGYSLQLCWTSGYLAGMTAAKNTQS